MQFLKLNLLQVSKILKLNLCWKISTNLLTLCNPIDDKLTNALN